MSLSPLLGCEFLRVLDYDFHLLIPSTQHGAWHREAAQYTFVSHLYPRGFLPQLGLRDLQALEGSFASVSSCHPAHMSHSD